MEQFLIFIVVAILSLLLNRNKKNQPEEGKQNKRKPQSMWPNAQPAHSSNEQRQQTDQTIRRELQDWKDNNTVTMNDIPATSSPLHRKREELALSMEKLKREEADLLKQAEVYHHQAEHVKQQPKLALRFSQEDVLNGIVMSEVLGPPRSRKAYQRR